MAVSFVLWIGAITSGWAKESDGNRTLSRSQYRDSLYVAASGDSVRVPFGRLFSFHTNVVDWVIATPNASVEVDFSPRKRSHYSLMLTGKWRPALNGHTINPRWVYNVSSVKGEVRRYWRTGNQEGVSLPLVERDTTLWSPHSKWSYFRRRVLSTRYVKHARYWRAYYLGLYGAYNKFSLCLDGDGKQGNSYSFGVSAGWSVPLYKRLDGSGWDFDIGASAGVMMSAYNEYGYERESACYVYTRTKERFTHPMVQDLHVSLVYRMRSVDHKVLYGATRFKLREDKREERERLRQEKIDAHAAKVDSTTRYRDINVMLDKSKEQLALYTDTTAYYYVVLKTMVDYTERNSRELRYDTDWQFNREVLMQNLGYYMRIANEMAPESQRTDRLEREKERKKEQLLRQKEEQKQAKEARKQQKDRQKQAKKEPNEKGGEE